MAASAAQTAPKTIAPMPVEHAPDTLPMTDIVPPPTRIADPHPSANRRQPECDDGPHRRSTPSGPRRRASRETRSRRRTGSTPSPRVGALPCPTHPGPARTVPPQVRLAEMSWRLPDESDGLLSNLVLVVGLRAAAAWARCFAPCLLAGAGLSLPGDEAGAAWAAGLAAAADNFAGVELVGDGRPVLRGPPRRAGRCTSSWASSRASRIPGEVGSAC